MDAKDIQQKIKDLYANTNLELDKAGNPKWKSVSDKQLLDNELRGFRNQDKAKDPEWLAKMDKINKERATDPEWLAKVQEVADRKKNDPEFQAKMDKINKERANDPEWLLATTHGAQKRSQDPNWVEANTKANQDPEKRKHQAQSITGKGNGRYKGDWVGTCVQTGKQVRATGAKELKELGFSPGMVSECCNGKRDVAKGYTWCREINND